MKLTDKEKTIKSLKSGAIGGESMKYKVKHTEIWSWYEIIEAKNEEELSNILDEYEWNLPGDADFEQENEWEELKV